MSRFAFAVFIALIGLASMPTPAHAWRGGGRDGFGWGFGSGVVLGAGIGACCGYSPYYSPYYSGYPAYYAPPPIVVYEAPPAPVTYVQPQQQVIYAQPQPAAQPVAASQASETFTDSSGRTCRNFQSSIDGAPVNGTACLQQDGSWRTVGP